jgi:hypothetical protein
VGMVESLWHTTKNQTNGYKDGLERGGGGGGGGRGVGAEEGADQTDEESSLSLSERELGLHLVPK